MKRAQMQFGETLMVVIVLVVIIMIGLVFYFNVKQAGVYKTYAYREDVESIKLAKQVLSLPEIQATDYGTGNGIDRLKMINLGEMIDEGDSNFDQETFDYYSYLFGYATIKLHVINLESGAADYVLYHDKPDPSVMNVTWSTQFIFTTLYDPLSDTEEMAYLNVTRYTRRFQ